MTKWDTENSYLASDVVGEGPTHQLPERDITYRIAVGLEQGRKLFTLHTRDPDQQLTSTLGKASWFMAHIPVHYPNGDLRPPNFPS